MSTDREIVLRTKLHQLECHFTWALIKDDIDLPELLNRLEEQLNLDLGKKEALARTYSALAYVKFLQGFQEEALNNLMTSVELYIEEDHEEEFHKTLIVTYGNLAWLNYHMKNYTECESYLQKLQTINEKHSTEASSVPEVLGEKGWTFLKFSHKYYERAKECFKKGLELEPEDSECNAGYAIALYRTEYGGFTIENSPTIKQLRRAIETNPDDDVLKVLLAIRLLKYKRYDEAAIFVEKALESSPDHPHVMRYVGKFFKNINTVDRSIALMSKALEQSPNSIFIHHQLALCYKIKKIQLLQEGNHHAKASQVQQIRGQIIYHLEMATTHSTGFISAMSDLALHYGERREISRAEELFQMTFQTAKEKNDSLYVVNFHYAEFQLHCIRCEALAIEHYMQCLKLCPVSYEWKRSYYSLKKIAEKRICKNTQDGEAYAILGFFHKESLSILEKAVELTPNSNFLHHQIGLCHKQQLIEMLSERRPGRRFPAAQISAKAAECIRHFSKAVELKPSNIYAQVNLAEAYGENRQLREAEKIFTSLINDTSLSEYEKLHCHTCYGVFLLYKRKDDDKAVSQFKIAYKIPVDNYDRKQAGKKLRQIVEKHLNAKHKVREAFKILAFVSSEDKQEAQAAMYLKRAQQHSDTDELSAAFAKGLRLKP